MKISLSFIFILKCFYKIKLIKINDYGSIHMQCNTWFKRSFLSTIALIFILMTVSDFSTFAIYVDVRIKNLWSISCVLFVPVHSGPYS